MSSPPLNEDEVHYLRTPRVPVGVGLGFFHPGGWPIRYSFDENRDGEAVQEVLSVAEATFKRL